MIYSLFDSTGNLIDAFTEREAAFAALKRIVHGDPDAHQAIVIAQDADGNIVETG